MNIDKFKILCEPISGKTLLEIYPEYSKLVYQSFVSDTPGIAIKRITNFFNQPPSINGNNIFGIVDIRDTLFKVSKQKEFVNAFAIVASHTHWKDRKPITYHFLQEENRYIIGTHSINPAKTYYPVSFAFNDKFPLAFEWCESKLINENELKVAAEIVIELNKSVAKKMYPIGIAIDFRFKSSLFEKPVPSIELPIDETKNEFYGYSEIITLEYFEANQQGEETEQVAWQPFSDLMLGLDEDELEVLNNLRFLVSSEKNEDAVKIIDKLNKEVNRKH